MMRKIPSKKRLSKPKPTFAEHSELARHVDPDELKNGGRVSSAAFVPNPSENYLSVNSLEIETQQDIATYYRNIFQNGSGEVAIACRKISDYNTAASNAGIMIKVSNLDGKWKYYADGSPEEAYKHRQTNMSYSHCGVEYLKGNLTDLTIKKIARRLSGRRPHLHKI